MTSNDEARMTNDEGMTKSEARIVRDDFEEAFWNADLKSVVREEPTAQRVYDLEERTARFGEAIIDFAKAIPQDAVTNRIISQLVGAGTSVGANYVEADDAVSKKEFLKKHCHVQEGGAGNQTSFAHGGPSGSRIKIRSAKALARSEGASSHLLKNLENQVMSFVIRASDLFRHSSFVIRHSSFSRPWRR